MEKANQVLNRIKDKLQEKDFFNGIEIAVVRKGDVYTDDICVRILVNSKGLNHKSIGVPQVEDGVPIEVTYRTIEAQAEEE